MIAHCKDWLISSQHVSYLLRISTDDILKTVRSITVFKAHRHDNMSIRMIEICDKNLVKILSIIY